MTSKVKTRILLLSDTHTELPASSEYHTQAYRLPLPEADLAIHTGDLTYNGQLEQHQSAIALLKSLPAPIKLVIPGNHDITLDESYYAEKGKVHGGEQGLYDSATLRQVRDFYTGRDAQEHGIYYLEEGVKTLRLANGAYLTVYGSAFTPEFCDWAFAYPRQVDRFNPDSKDATTPIPPCSTLGIDSAMTASMAVAGSTADVQPRVDIVLTHGPPYKMLDQTQPGCENVGCPHLMRAVSKARPLLHCFGHIHEGWGAKRKIWSDSIAAPRPPPPPQCSPSQNTCNTSGLCRERASSKPDQDLDQRDQSPPQSFLRSSSSSSSSSKTYDVNDRQRLMTERSAYIDATDLRRGHETLFVNASIMTVNYEPLNAPWLVDLMLDR